MDVHPPNWLNGLIFIDILGIIIFLILDNELQVMSFSIPLKMNTECLETFSSIFFFFFLLPKLLLIISNINAVSLELGDSGFIHKRGENLMYCNCKLIPCSFSASGGYGCMLLCANTCTSIHILEVSCQVPDEDSCIFILLQYFLSSPCLSQSVASSQASDPILCTS